MTDLIRIDQDEFVGSYWLPDPGEHVTLIGPTGVGKTTFGLKLVAKQVRSQPGARGLALVMKPDKGPKPDGWFKKRTTGDETVARLTKKLGGKVTRDWPPPAFSRRTEPAFWSYWPRHTMNPYQDGPVHAAAFSSALLDTYKHGNYVIFADETYGLTKELGLTVEVVTQLSKGRSMLNSFYSATQRPANVPMSVYSDASHFFIWRIRDAGQFERLREIGNADPKLIVETLKKLKKHECLYLYPPGDIMCIVG